MHNAQILWGGKIIMDHAKMFLYKQATQTFSKKLQKGGVIPTLAKNKLVSYPSALGAHACY